MTNPVGADVEEKEDAEVSNCNRPCAMYDVQDIHTWSVPLVINPWAVQFWRCVSSQGKKDRAAGSVDKSIFRSVGWKSILCTSITNKWRFLRDSTVAKKNNINITPRKKKEKKMPLVSFNRCLTLLLTVKKHGRLSMPPHILSLWAIALCEPSGAMSKQQK